MEKIKPSNFVRHYRRLNQAADSFFGGIGALTTLLAVIALLRKEVGYGSLILIFCFSVPNVFYTRLVLRSRRSPVSLELARLIVNFIICPIVYCLIEPPLASWWPVYVMFVLGAVLVTCFSFCSDLPARFAIVAWTGNFLLCALWLRPLMDLYQVAYVAGTMLMVGFVSLDWMRTAQASLLREEERSAELQRAIEDLALEKAQILKLHEQLEAQRINVAQSAKMAALGEMAGGMAHEINSPLTIIGVVASQMQEMVRAGEFDQVTIEKMLGTVMSTNLRISKIVSGLRAFSREGSNDPLQATEVMKIVEETLILCAEKLKYEGIRLDVEGRPGVSIQCRPVEVSQALLNLLINAGDAAVASVEKWVKVAVLLTKHGVEISVADSGPGIPAALRERIFQPFFTTKPLGKGTGMGLSVSKGLTEAQGGSLFLQEGTAHTQFVLRFPVEG